MDPVDTSPAPGRWPIRLSPRWTAVVLEPIPGRLALGFFRDGVPVEVVDDDEDARAHVIGLRRSFGPLG